MRKIACLAPLVALLIAQTATSRTHVTNRLGDFVDRHETKKLDVQKEFETLRVKAQACRLGQHCTTATYSLDELVELTRHRNYTIRANAEKVYRARHNIKVAIGRLIPSLSLDNVLAGAEMNFFDLVPALLGFLFPSNWFRWEESKLYYEAEKRGYAVLVANQVNAVESQYYQVHLIDSMDRFYGEYSTSLDSIIAKVRIRVNAGEDLFIALAKLENILVRVKQDHLRIKETLNELRFNLSFAAALNYQDWMGMRLRSIDLPDLSATPDLVPSDIEPDASERALELKQLAYMVKAADYARKARMFEFLTPGSNSDAALGFGYSSYLKIGKSEKREMEIRHEEMGSRIRLAVEKAVNNYNTTLKSYRESKRGFDNSMLLINFTVRQFDEGGIFDAAELVDAVEAELGFKVQMLLAQHRNLISQAQVDRLIYAEPHYGDMMSVLPSDIKQGKRGVRCRLEDRRIRKDLENGNLVLPD